jgi:hypothetical protein
MATRGHENSMLVDAMAGAAAGALAVWVMDQVDWFMYDHEDPEARHRTQRVRPDGMDPAHVAVNRAAEAAGMELSPHQPHPLGVAMHYSLGVGPGALYGALRDRFPVLGTGRGTLYGLGLFLLQDEVVNAASGLSAKPTDYPWQAHARGLVTHLVYGVVTDTVLSVLKGPGSPIRYSKEEQRSRDVVRRSLEFEEGQSESHLMPASSRDEPTQLRH